jgi:N-acyl-D-aspartate/D-glutamate deacylase
MDFTLKSPYLFEGIAAWRPAMEAHGEALKRVYADQGFREAVKAGLAKKRGTSAFNGEWDKVHVVEVAQAQHRALEQRSVDDIARQLGKDPLDAMLDLALAEGLETVFSALLLNSDEEAVGRLLADPHALVSLSDAGAHLTFFNDAGFGLHLLGHWTRELGALRLEEAAWRLTGQPAGIYGIKERGALVPGYHADLLLFDPRTVNRTPNRRVFDLPAGQPRLTAEAIGVHGVWVNGERIVDSQGLRSREKLPGRLLRHFAP